MVRTRSTNRIFLCLVLVAIICILLMSWPNTTLQKTHHDMTPFALIEFKNNTLQKTNWRKKSIRLRYLQPPPKRSVPYDTFIIGRNKTLDFDHIGPTVQRSVSHLVPSVPYELQRGACQDQSQSLKEELLFYNPTIIQIQTPISNAPSEAQYVGSFRGSIIQCNTKTIQYDYVALVLMDGMLNILTSVVVDPNVHVKTRGIVESFQDYRLFYLHGTLYLTDTCLMMPIQIHIDTLQPHSQRKIAANHHHHHLDIVYGGSDMYVTTTGCRVIMRHDGQRLAGKNFNFLQHKGRTYMEWWPIPRSLSIVDYVNDPKQVFVMLQKPTQTKRDVVSMPFEQHAMIVGQKQQDEMLVGQYKFTKDRGTACCATLERDHYQDLLPLNKNGTLFDETSLEIGLSHLKSFTRLPGVNRFSYLTRLYAASSDNPHRIVAQSALFCLNWQDDDWKDPTANLLIQGVAYDCPAVHFPTGICASASDPTKILVAYGILDRQSRIVEYSKRDLAQLLFSTDDGGS